MCCGRATRKKSELHAIRLAGEGWKGVMCVTCSSGLVVVFHRQEGEGETLFESI
jgi:hypothetical protein